MPNKPKKYSGILAKPIDLRKTPFGTDLNAFVDGEISTRIRALLDHCDIDALYHTKRSGRSSLSNSPLLTSQAFKLRCQSREVPNASGRWMNVGP